MERSSRPNQGLRAGADDILVKPIDPEELALRLGIAQRILAVHARLEQANGCLAELAIRDELTGLVNRREFQRLFDLNVAMASRQAVPVSLLFLDIDHFKRFNDAFGHPAGDVALRTFADTVRASCRHYEPAGRLGGEEFGIVLYGACGATARAVAQRIRDALARQTWAHRTLTASFGAATTGPDIRTTTELIEAADLALEPVEATGSGIASPTATNRSTSATGIDIVPAPGKNRHRSSRPQIDRVISSFGPDYKQLLSDPTARI